MCISIELWPSVLEFELLVHKQSLHSAFSNNSKYIVRWVSANPLNNKPEEIFTTTQPTLGLPLIEYDDSEEVI